MTRKDIKPVVPGQEICFSMDSSNAESMSSLESFMSFMDDSEQDDRQREEDAMIPTKKRCKPRTTGLHPQRNLDPHSPPPRSSSNSDFGINPRRPASRWDTGRTHSCQSSPGQPRCTRHPPTTSNPGKEGGGLDTSSHHSLASLKLKALEGDRWSADAGSANLHSSGGGNSSGRWQDSFGGESGHEHSSWRSRWSNSLTSSQIDQLSTRPRFPHRKRSGLQGMMLASSSNHSTKEVVNSSSAMTAINHMLPAENLSEAATHTSDRAFEPLSTQVESDSRITENCNQLLQGSSWHGPATLPFKSHSPPTPSLPAVKSTNKPRPQIPHRQKSFRPGMSVGMAAKAFMEGRENLIKQRSEPNLAAIHDHTASDLSLSSHCTTEKLDSDTEMNPAHSSPLRKQKSLSCLAMDIPQLPKRQSSQNSSLTLTSNQSGNSSRRRFRKQRSLSSLDEDACEACCRTVHKSDIPQLPQRTASEISSRAHSRDQGREDEDYWETKVALSRLPKPPSMPRRQSSMGSMSTVTATVPLEATDETTGVLPTEEEKDQLCNRRSYLKKQISEPSGLSLKHAYRLNSSLFGEDDWGVERPNKRHGLLDLTISGTPNDVGGTNISVLSACRRLLTTSGHWGQRSFPD